MNVKRFIVIFVADSVRGARQGREPVAISNGQGVGAVFQLLRDGEPHGRSELVELSGLSRSTVGLRLDALLQLGLIAPASGTTSTGGRPSTKVVLSPAVYVIAAADLGAMHARVALTDLSGTFLTEATVRIAIADGPQKVLGWVVETITRLMAEIGRDGSDLAAIGIGLPGPVEHTTGLPFSPPIMPGWDRFDVPAWMNKTYDVPVLVDNDVNIMALGERATIWPETKDLILIKVATGIGAGVISSGVLQRGAEGVAGDIGHVQVSRAAGVQCNCGNVGCLESIAGAPAILASMKALGTSVDSVGDLIALVRSGNITALRVVRQAGRDIGEIANMCVSFINPSVIVIGGAMADAGEHLLAGIREVVYARSMPLATQNLIITPSKTGPHGAAIGASILAIDHILSPEYIDALAAGRGTARLTAV